MNLHQTKWIIKVCPMNVHNNHEAWTIERTFDTFAEMMEAHKAIYENQSEQVIETLCPIIPGTYRGYDHEGILEWEDPETGEIQTAQGQFNIDDGVVEHDVIDEDGRTMYYVIA